jgi:hypothetical protein
VINSKFNIGDLIVVTNTQTTGIQTGEHGIVSGVERVANSHIIYWVSFGFTTRKIPMWSNEMELVS